MLAIFDAYSTNVTRSVNNATPIGNSGYNSTLSLGYTFTVKPQDVYNQSATAQVVFQVEMIFITLGLALAGGIVTGCILKLFGLLSKTTIDEADQYQDKTTFVVPSDFPE